PDPLLEHGGALPRVDDGEVEVVTPLDHDPVIAEVELVQLAMFAVDERVADELSHRGQHAAEDVLVLVLGQAAGQVVQEDTIAVHEEDIIDLCAESAVHRDDVQISKADSDSSARNVRASPPRLMKST